MIGDSKLLTSAAWDAQSLNELKAKAGQDPAANIRPVARQVEGMFVQMMLKSMREALPKDGVFSSDSTRLYTSMYDQQIAQQMTAGKGLGLAEMMVKQMTEGQAQPADDAPQVPMKFSLETVTSYQNQALTQLVRKAIPGRQKVMISRCQVTAKTSSPSCHCRLSWPVSRAGSASSDFGAGGAGVGWGQRQIRRENGEPSFNIFGVKASGSWKGPTTEITTTEYENGEAKKVKARFRVYSSYLEALSDYVGLISRNPRYAAVTLPRPPNRGAGIAKCGLRHRP